MNSKPLERWVKPPELAAVGLDTPAGWEIYASVKKANLSIL